MSTGVNPQPAPVMGQAINFMNNNQNLKIALAVSMVALTILLSVATGGAAAGVAAFAVMLPAMSVKALIAASATMGALSLAFIAKAISLIKPVIPGLVDSSRAMGVLKGTKSKGTQEGPKFHHKTKEKVESVRTGVANISFKGAKLDKIGKERDGGYIDSIYRHAGDEGAPDEMKVGDPVATFVSYMANNLPSPIIGGIDDTLAAMKENMTILPNPRNVSLKVNTLTHAKVSYIETGEIEVRSLDGAGRYGPVLTTAKYKLEVKILPGEDGGPTTTHITRELEKIK